MFDTNTFADTWPSGPSALWAFTFILERRCAFRTSGFL